MPLTENSIIEQLKTVRYPGFSRDVVSFGLVREVAVKDGDVRVRLAITTADDSIPEKLRAAVTEALQGLKGAQRIDVKIDVAAAPPVPPAGTLPQTKIPGVEHVIAVASGKGGVGKSTVAANLAVALQQLGHRVGLCDCDLYGPSIALMFGSNERPGGTEDGRILPIERYGLRLMSMGFLLEDDAPAILRGPMVTRYTQQFLRMVEWGELDYLILDLPPGTGDIQLTIVQTVALSGAVIVTTPQEVALIDARKAASMFAKVNVRVLGLVENMSYFVAPESGQRHDIFGSGGGEREAARLGVPLMAQIPLEPLVRETGDQGMPVTAYAPQSASAKTFAEAAEKIAAACPAAAVSR